MRAILAISLSICASVALAQEKQPEPKAKPQPMTPGGIFRAHDMTRPRPPVITPPGLSSTERAGQPPSDAVVLFDGANLSKWKREPRKDSPPGDDQPQWKIENGYAEITPKSGAIRTREKFKGDLQVHIEWATPAAVSGSGQGRGNSGVFIGGFPEIQVLDSHQNDTYPDGQAAGLYGNYPPMVNASRKPGEWQTYDILVERARLDANGKPVTKARLTVIHNGVVAHYLREFDSAAQEGDLMLQDHNNPVRYRNIWVRPLLVDPDAAGTPPPAKPATNAKNPPPADSKARKQQAPAADSKAGKDKTAALGSTAVAIKTLTAQMKYDTAEFTVRPGQQVSLRFENGDDLPHNLVFCQPGTDTAAMALKQMDNPEAALKRDWLPDDPRIWAHTKMLNPHQSEMLDFTAPEKPGDYPYVCTFPGHALTMRGVLRVLPLGEGLRDLRFALYLGKWDALPDFSKLRPHREGALPDNLIQIKLDDYKNEFGVVYSARLHAPRTGSYRFYIAGDDGVRLLIDGKELVRHDGIHPAGEVKEAATQLTAGPHDLRLEYFQAGGDVAVFAAWKGANFDITPLSAWVPAAWAKNGKPKKQKDYDPIPLMVKQEPVVYRNFIAGAGNRAIAVGYPGGVNIAFSAETMNLALYWKGAFIDAARHWNSRGGGYEPPLGYDVVSPAPGVPFAALPAPEKGWPTVTDPRAAGYSWMGYELDASRAPVFHYTWGETAVTERYTPKNGGLLRTVTLAGATPPHAMLRLATGKIKALAGGEKYLVEAGRLDLTGRVFENRFTITAPGARIVGENLLLPVQTGEVRIEYGWP